MKKFKPFSWSFSMLDAFDTCARQLRETRIVKRYSDRNRWNVGGVDNHAAIEDYVKGQPLIPDLKKYEPKLDRLLAIPGIKKPEIEVCVTEDWKPTGWFAKDAWARAKIDLQIVDTSRGAVVQVDWKTGQRRKDNRFFQLDVNNVLTDAVCRAHGFEPEVYENALVWVMQDFELETYKNRREDLPDVRDSIMEKVAEYRAAYDADDFPPTQNGLCKRYCPVLDCEFNGQKV